MPFPVVIAKAQRDSVLSNIIEALDICESLSRTLPEMQPHHVALNDETLLIAERETRTAYNALMKARQAIEEYAKLVAFPDDNFSKKV